MNCSYGQMDESGGSTAEQVLATIPLVQAISEELVDPFRQAELLRVKLQQARASGNMYEIQRLEAKLRAAERKVALQESRDQYWEDLRTLTRAGGLAVLVVAGAGVVFLLSRSFK